MLYFLCMNTVCSRYLVLPIQQIVKVNKDMYSRRLARKLVSDKLSGGICENCKEKVILLYVHHIDCNPRNNIVTNLQVICSSCHRKIHPTPFGNHMVSRNICS